ncbi:DNA-binding HxlR family transcriptional regulator [Amycolatopsis bartoniae]|uniref:ArsR family transcriptional regulator n=1 Tax=Amycolatopsis bartoniae TaxID=941986 RepID=A0A8H9IUW9_9PSEU|nr:helix-turn-helix domain-containing protein [Amycolatopsis bartoniae]MBB2936053.1 DNA-binding HxlR family transcriptional regulator [Amycolatopsis bartoniae]TVT03542.1 helix-turn-helix transcriptional regulator [Amycolatopsis bartoniae]GHF63791.1 ArsR family transcriptional regulator [Amycolatopsis bartoniae]
MALKSDYTGQECSIARTLEVVGERWTFLILRDLFFGLRRFTDLYRHLAIPKAVLTVRLERLVAAGVLARTESQYRLTAKGLDLWPALHALNDWGNTHLAPHGPRALFLHVDCGSVLVSGGFCAGCGRIPAVTEVEYRPGPGQPPDPADPVDQALRPAHRLLEPLLLG